MNINEITESVDETEPAENSENTEKLGTIIIVSEISISSFAVAKLKTLLI